MGPKRALPPASQPPPRTAKKPHLEVSNKSSKWNKGDFTLVSSDDITFRIDTHYLLSASSVFRDMLSVGNGQKELHLTDLDFETGAIVEVFLNFITTGCSTIDASDLTPMNNLIRLLLKYDCTLGLKLVAAQSQQNIVDHTSAWQCFTIGAVTDDVELCCAAIRGSISHSRYGRLGKAFNPQCMSFDVASQIPLAYLWALGRMWGGLVASYDLFPQDFKRFLSEANTTVVRR